MKLKAKFTLIVSVFVVTLLALVAFFTQAHYKQSIKETIAEQQFRMLSLLSDEIDNKLLSAQQHIIAVVKTAPTDIMQHPDKAQALLDSMASLHMVFDNKVFLFTPSGKVFVESPDAPGRRGFDLSFREYISNTIRTNKPYISDPYISTLPHKHPVIMFTAPLFDGKGKITGILGGGIDLMRDNFLGRIATEKIGETGYFYLTSMDRTLIMHPDKTRILTKQPPGMNRLYDKAIGGFEGTDETTTSYGIKMLASFKRMKVKDWMLIANSPQAEAYRPIRQAERSLLIATATGLIAIFFIISYIIRYLVKPLELFTRHIEALPQKTGDDRFLDIKTRDEIGTLSLTFNKMVSEIDKRLALERESEERLNMALKAAGQSIYDSDLKTGAAIVSPEYALMLGYDPAEFHETTAKWFERLHPDDKKPVAAVYRAYIKGEIPEYKVEFRQKTKDGNWKWILSLAKITQRDADGNPLRMIGTHTDITERKELEAQLRHAQKMESIGILAGGVAHDFNNILSAIIGYGHMAQTMLKSDITTQGYIQEMLDAANRAAELTKGLLAFSRKQVINPVLMDLNEIVRNFDKMLRRIIGEDIKLGAVLSPRELPVMVDAGQMEQVLMNLATNARDAMPDGGQLTIETDAVYVDSHYAEVHFSQNAYTYAVMKVSDTGGGMDQVTKENIFEPFFTTKEVGKGTGLGLSMVYGIIKQHNGNVRVYSEVERGTTFKIYLPLVQTKKETISMPIETLPEGQGETILIAEDEPQVRGSMSLILQANGYKIIEAENGEDAVRKFQNNRDGVTLILLDVIMPIKNGREAYAEMNAIKPGVRTIFMSGYTDDIISKKGILEDGFELISKPINPDTLMRRIRDVLDR